MWGKGSSGVQNVSMMFTNNGLLVGARSFRPQAKGGGSLSGGWGALCQ